MSYELELAGSSKGSCETTPSQLVIMDWDPDRPAAGHFLPYRPRNTSAMR